MHPDLQALLLELLGDDDSATHIVEILGRDGFLSSPLETGFTDRQIRIVLINMLGRLGDASALSTLEKHARTPPVLGGKLVADAANQAIAEIRSALKPASAVPFAERMTQKLVQQVADDLEAALTAPKSPLDLEAAGFRGRELQRALLELDQAESLPSTGTDSLAHAASCVVQAMRQTDCDEASCSEVERVFSDPGDVDRWFDVTILLRSRGYFHAGLKAYDLAVGRFSPEIDAMWWSNRGWLLLLWERYGDAVASYQKALEIDATYERARISLQDLHRLLRAPSSAEQSTSEVDDSEARQVPQPYEPRRLHRKVGSGNQKQTQSYALLSPASLAIVESEPYGASIDTISSKSVPPDAPANSDNREKGDLYFISYRWESLEHQQWAFRFAESLQKRGYRVIFDQFEDIEYRDRIGPMLRTDRMQDEIPRLVRDINRATVFLPILTEGYRRCVEPRRSGDPFSGGDKELWSLHTNPDDGWVFDEWQLALRQRLADKIRWQAVWRNGPFVPLPFTRHSITDFRDDENYETMLDSHFPRRGDG